VGGQFRSPEALSRERSSGTPLQEAGRVPESVCRFPRRDKTLTPTGIRNPDRPVRSLVNISDLVTI